MTGLFYRGRLNSVYGASGDGKTWVALLAAAERVAAGEPPMLIDYEDSADGITSRLVAMRLDPAAIGAVLYRNPGTGIGSAWGQAAMRASIDLAPTLVVIDSVGEAMALAGIDSNSDTEVAGWMARLKPITRWPSRPAVVMLDHIPKNTENPTRGAIGSQRKLAAITGAAYRTQVIKPFSKTVAGSTKLIVDKDRLGTRPRGSTAAVFHFTPDGNHIDVTVDNGGGAVGTDGHWRPTVLMERVCEWLALYPGSTGRQVEQGVRGKGADLRAALTALVAEGFVEAVPGERNAFHHTVKTPFVDEFTGTASHRVPTASHRVRGRGANPQNDRVPRPPLIGDAETRSLGRTDDQQDPQRPRPIDDELF